MPTPIISRVPVQVVLFSCVLFFGAAKASDEPAASIPHETMLWSVKGQVQVLAPGHEMGSCRAFFSKETVSEGAIVATGDAPSFAGLVLPDNSLLKISPNSVVQISANDHKIFLKSGQIVFNQPKKSLRSTHYMLYTAKNMIIPQGQVRLSAGVQNDECKDMDKGHSKVISLLPENAVKTLPSSPIY